MICGDKNKSSFYFFQIGSQIVPFLSIYTDQPVSKICNVTRPWACRLGRRKLRIYKILMLKPFQNSPSGILRYETVYSGRWKSTFLCNKPETSSWESHSASVVQTISKLIWMPSLFQSWQSLVLILNGDFKNFITISLWQPSAHHKPNIIKYIADNWFKLHHQLKFDLESCRALMSLMTHQYNIEILYKGDIIVHGIITNAVVFKSTAIPPIINYLYT